MKVKECVCVCEREREKERERVCEGVRERKKEWVSVWRMHPALFFLSNKNKQCCTYCFLWHVVNKLV